MVMQNENVLVLPTVYQGKEDGEGRGLAFRLCSWRKVAMWRHRCHRDGVGRRESCCCIPASGLSMQWSCNFPMAGLAALLENGTVSTERGC